MGEEGDNNRIGPDDNGPTMRVNKKGRADPISHDPGEEMLDSVGPEEEAGPNIMIGEGGMCDEQEEDLDVSMVPNCIV